MVARNVVTLIGRLGTSEEWSTRFAYAPTAGLEQPYNTTAELTEWAEAAAAFLETQFGIVGNPLVPYLSDAGTIDTIRIDWLDIANVVTASGQAPVDVQGLNPVQHPYQTAIVFSLRTALPGASHRGRSYFPFLGGTLESPGGTISAAGRTAAVNAYHDMLEGIQLAQPDPDRVQLGVASETLNSFTPVNNLQVGSAPDTQRRRRNGLVEIYTTVAFP